MLNTLGLVNAHTTYCASPLPPTHERGSHPISGIFISPTLIPIRAGILRHGVGILGDHRNMFVDFHEYNVLGDEIYTIPPPKMRRLQLYDSRIVNKFNKTCENHLKNNNIHTQLLELTSKAIYPPPPHISQKMQTIDEQIGRAIASGEKHCRKLRTGAIPYSSEYNKVKNSVRFWYLLIKQQYGKRISNTTIPRLARANNIPQPHKIDHIEAKH